MGGGESDEVHTGRCFLHEGHHSGHGSSSLSSPASERATWPFSSRGFPPIFTRRSFIPGQDEIDAGDELTERKDRDRFSRSVSSKQRSYGRSGRSGQFQLDHPAQVPESLQSLFVDLTRLPVDDTEDSIMLRAYTAYCAFDLSNASVIVKPQQEHMIAGACSADLRSIRSAGPSWDRLPISSARECSKPEPRLRSGYPLHRRRSSDRQL